jgi:glycosyltransferase involved in cell wall biosynthesis
MLDSAGAWRPDAPPPRIAVICHTHPSISKGGAEIAAYSVFRGLRNLGHDALFIACCSDADRGRLHLGLPQERAVFFEPQRYDHFYHRGTLPVARELTRLLQAEGVGLANFHHYMSLGLGAIEAAKRQAGAVVVVTLHEYLAICHNHGQMVTRPARSLCEGASPEACNECFPEHHRSQFVLRREGFRRAFRSVDGFISPSRFLADRYADWGLEPARIEVIENGLLGLAGTPAPPRPRRGGEWVFGYFGQINEFKGVDLLLRAAALLAERRDLAGRFQFRVHGNLVGRPSFVEAFEKAAEEFPFFSYAGAYANSTVRRLMAECDYVVVPSAWWENSPTVIQEAYAAGRPVLCSGIGGMAEKVPEGVTGLHFHPGSAADLVRAMEEAADAATHARLAAALPRPFDETEMARQYLAAFAAAGRRAAPAAAAAGPEAEGDRAC